MIAINLYGWEDEELIAVVGFVEDAIKFVNSLVPGWTSRDQLFTREEEDGELRLGENRIWLAFSPEDKERYTATGVVLEELKLAPTEEGIVFTTERYTEMKKAL